MFESNDDIDDEFLNGVFDNDQEGFGTALTLQSKNWHRSTLNNHHIGLHSTLPVRDDQKSTPIMNPSICPEARAGGNSCPNLIHNQQSNLKSRDSYFLPDRPSCHLYQNNKENNENKRKHEISSLVTPKSKRERKFPGPAGLLPDRKLSVNTPLKLDSLLEVNKSLSTPSTDDLCSQGRCSGSVLEEEPWQSLLADLGSERSILDEVNVASVKRKAAARCFVGRKLPFLAAVLHHLDVSSPDPCIILRDSTGEIHGTLHRHVWEQFAGELIVGSVLVVRNVGLLSTGISSRRHYLNITANNLVTIYSANSDKLQKPWLHPFTTKDFLQTIQNWRSLVSPCYGVESPGSIGSPALFNTSLNNSFSNSPVQSPGNVNTSANFSSAPRRTEENRSNNNPVQVSNLRQRIAQNGPYRSNTRPPAHHTPVGKNLLPSFSSNSSQSSTCINKVTNNLTNHNRSLSNNHTNNLFQNKIISSHSNSSSITVPNCNPQRASSSSSSFKFDPVILKPKRFELGVSPQINTELSFNSQRGLKPSDTGFEENNSSKIVLSQTSQLTAEEQSLVESVFDGIDADSLFDDDF